MTKVCLIPKDKKPSRLISKEQYHSSVRSEHRPESRIIASNRSVIVPNSTEDEDTDSPFGSLIGLNTNKKPRAIHTPIMDPSVGDDFNFEHMINKIIDEKSLIPKDLKFDDSSLPEAPNFYHWMCDESYLNQDKPYLTQLLMGIRVFAEYCPQCTDLQWLYDDYKVNDTFKKFERKVQLYEYGTCPKCGTRRSKQVKAQNQDFYNELAMAAGQRSGKSHLVGGMLCTYQTHKILKMQSPALVYGISKGTLLHGTFVATTYAQARDTLWQPYYHALMDSSWFQQYHTLLKGYEAEYGLEIVKLKDTFVLYRHRSLFVYPAPPDVRTLRGRTRVFASIDEIAFMDNSLGSKSVRTSATEIYQALGRSLLTVRSSARKLLKNGFDNVLSGYFFNVSSTFSVRDKICELVRQSMYSKNILGLIKPTWEVNPNITRQDLNDEFSADPVRALRDYGSQPPMSANPFISSMSMVQDCLKERGTNLIKVRYETIHKEDGTIERFAEPLLLKPTGHKSILAIDAGVSNNSFACCVGHIADGISTIDILVEICPLPGIRLNFSLIYSELLLPIMEARNVKVMLADRWNSIKILSDAELDIEGLVTKQYSLKYPDMWDVKTRMEQQVIQIPRPNKDITIEEILKYDIEQYPQCFEHRPVEHLILQLLTIQDTKTQVVKGDGNLTDDLWRALALCTWGLNCEEFSEILHGVDEVHESYRPKAIGVSRNQSGGGVGGQGSSSNGPTINGRTVGLLKTRR